MIGGANLGTNQLSTLQRLSSKCAEAKPLCPWGRRMWLNVSTQPANPQRAKLVLKNSFPVSFKRTIYHCLEKTNMLFDHTSNFVRPEYRCCDKGLKKGDVKFIIFHKNLDWMRCYFSLILSCINPRGLLLHRNSPQSSVLEHQSIPLHLRFDLCSIM